MAVSELPGNPNAVWTVKRSSAGMSECAASKQKSNRKQHYFYLVSILFFVCLTLLFHSISMLGCYVEMMIILGHL